MLILATHHVYSTPHTPPPATYTPASYVIDANKLRTLYTPIHAQTYNQMFRVCITSEDIVTTKHTARTLAPRNHATIIYVCLQRLEGILFLSSTYITYSLYVYRM